RGEDARIGLAHAGVECQRNTRTGRSTRRNVKARFNDVRLLGNRNTSRQQDCSKHDGEQAHGYSRKRCRHGRGHGKRQTCGRQRRRSRIESQYPFKSLIYQSSYLGRFQPAPRSTAHHDRQKSVSHRTPGSAGYPVSGEMRVGLVRDSSSHTASTTDATSRRHTQHTLLTLGGWQMPVAMHSHGIDGWTTIFGTPTGPQRDGSVRPKRPTTGVPAAAAMCIGPLSLPRNSRARSSTASNISSDMAPTRFTTGDRDACITDSASSCSSGPPTRAQARPARREISSIAVAKRSGGQHRPLTLAPAWMAMNEPGPKPCRPNNVSASSV